MSCLCKYSHIDTPDYNNNVFTDSNLLNKKYLMKCTCSSITLLLIF